VTVPTHTYMLSNRVGQADCSAPGPVTYLSNINFPSQAYNEIFDQETLSKAAWIAQLADDLYRVCSDQQRPVVLAFYVHGFDTSATDARIAHAYYGSRLNATGLDQSVVVAASWPSNCDTPYWARKYAEQSVDLMTAILEAITLVKKQLVAKYGKSAPRLVTSVIAHSMGNYLMSTTLASGNVPNYAGAVDWVLMLAPDVDHAIFTQGSSVENQGRAIYQMASGNVWVFWTWNDLVLQADEYAGYWEVLGYRGPQLPISSATPGVLFIDAGTVANTGNAEVYVPYDYGSLAVVHSSYRFVTQLVFWQILALRFGKPDKQLESVIAASSLDSKSNAVPEREPLDQYIFRNFRRQSHMSNGTCQR
jgi:Alpha/beta hydrolase of unknown function (DUF900)